MNRYQSLEQIALETKSPLLWGEPMRRHTTFKIGGPADAFLQVNNETALCKVLECCHREGLPVLVLGNGSNLLVPDEGLRGVVITLGGEFRDLKLLEDHRIWCGAGTTLARLCKFAEENTLTGLEFAWGIPGSAGGAAYMNAGAYDGEMKQVLKSCRHVSMTGQAGALKGEALQLSYRHSAYAENRCAITSLTVQLTPGQPEAIAGRMEELMERRRSKQPLEFPSAGSVFKRPAGHFAGGLIEQCGLKGLREGGARVSEKHAGFIISDGTATCQDVLRLIERIQHIVKKETGVSLECEVRAINPNTLSIDER